MSTNNYAQQQFCDWRESLKKNQRKTVYVITLFVLIYLFVGFIVDIYLYGGFVTGRFFLVTKTLLTLQVTPLITLIMGGVAIISLLVTYALYDRIMLLGTNSREVTPNKISSSEEQQLYNIVEEMKIAAGLRHTPKIYIIDANYINAFASGYSEKSAMIAVTRGLIQKLNRSELQAVIAHELSHIRHGDIKLALTASVLANIMLIVLDILFYSVLFGRQSRRQGGNKFAIVIILLRYLLPVITVLLMLYLSRTREYMADAGSVELLRDNQPIANALLKISGDHEKNFDSYQEEYSSTPS